MKKGREKKNRVCAAFLCVCMLFSLPGISDIFPVVAAAEQAESFQKENIITAFDPLSEEVKIQTVFTGTDRDELNLPEKLTVYLLYESSEQKMEESEQENTRETNDIEENSDTETKDEQGTQAEETDETTATDSKDAIDTEKSEEDSTGESALAEEQCERESVQENASSEEQQENAVLQETHTVTMQEYHAENVISVQTIENTQTEKQEETVAIGSVTWQSEPEYDGNTEGIYTFTAVLPEGYTLAEGVSLPQITVTVKESESGTDFVIQALLERIAALPDAEEYLALEPDMEDEDTYAEWEEKLYEYAEEALAIWKEYEALAEEQQEQMPEEELAKLESWMELAEQLSDHAVMLAVDSEHHAGWTALSSSEIELNGGNYYLAGPISMGTITIKGDVTLCLNGQTLTHSGNTGSVIVVESGTFTLCDCQDHWDYTSSFNEDTKTYSCSITGKGGCITGGSGNNYQGGGVYVGSGATFNMNSGRITGCDVGTSAYAFGGGVYVTGGTFNMSGGFIDGNNAGSGSVYIDRATFNMSGNAVIMNNTGLSCGGIQLGTGSAFNMYSGAIIGNEATGNGAGVFLGGGTEFNMTGGIIEGNRTTSAGVNSAGGIYSNAATTNLSGNCSIQHNIANKGTGGVRVHKSSSGASTFMVSGNISISNNYNESENSNVSLNSDQVILLQSDLLNNIGVTYRPASGTFDYPVTVVNGTEISDADWSHFFSDNEELKIVKAGNELKLYPLSTCDLSGLDLTAEGAKLEPNFQADIITYKATVGSEVEKVGITATLAGSTDGKTIKIKNGTVLSETDMTSGIKKDVPLAVGLNTIEITVASGSETKTYTIKITREAPAGNPVTITTNKDGVEWTENPPTYKLIPDNGTTPVTDLTAVPDGTYRIYYGSDKNIDTGVEVKVEGAAATATVNYYTVTFYDGDDELPTPTQQIVPAGATASAPTDNPTKTGYTFSEWVTKTVGGGSTEYGFNEAVTGKTSVYASWLANTYTVTYNGNGSTGGSTADSSHTYDTAKDLTANSFTRSCKVTFNLNYTGSSSTDKTAAYTFAGWNTKADGSGTSYDDNASVKNLTETNNGTVTLYAQWTPTSVTYTPTRAGYTFAGWYAEASCTDSRADSDGTYTPTGDMITLYAKWAPESYHVTLNTNGGTGGTSLTSYTCGTVITLPTNWTKTGYTFAGWYDNKDCTGTAVTEISATDTGDKTFWAKWTPQTYQVTFHYHGADGGNTETSKNVTYDGAYGDLPVPTRTGYTFKGWYTEESGQGNKVDADTIVTTASAHILHAYWKDETAPNQPVLQDDVTLPAGWTKDQDTIPLKLYDGVGVTSLLVSVDGNADYIEVSGFSGGTAGSVDYSYTAVQAGEHTYQFKAVDAAGNISDASDPFTVKLDKTPPVIGTLTYDNAVHTNLWHWIIGKKSMVVHVPVTDAGSGVTEISYTMTPRDAAGNLASSSAETKTATVTNGEAKITFDKDFRGTIAISCTDVAGNAADGVTIGKDAGGVIVEDTPPTITALADRKISDTQQTQPDGVDVSGGYYDSAPALLVTVKDDTGNVITAGIATVKYKVGDGTEQFVIDSASTQAEVTFTIPASEIPTGITEIKVTATDNAGNEATKTFNVKVKGPEKQPDAKIDYRQEELTGLVPGAKYTIDGTAYTADGEGRISIKEDWFDNTVNIIKKGNGSETSDSTAQNLSIPARPAAPDTPELSTRDDKSITLKTILNAQYRLADGTDNWQDSTAFTGLDQKTIYRFRAYYPATDTSFASSESDEAQIATMPTAPTQDKLRIGYAAETFTLTDGIEAFTDAGCTTPVTAGSVADYMGRTVYIRYPANDIIPASLTTPVPIPARPAKPAPGKEDASYPKATDGAITGLTPGTTYEYRVKDTDGNFGAWKTATPSSTKIENLPAGDYEVRVKAVETGNASFQSEAAAVTIGATPATKYETPKTRIDYPAETLTGFVPGAEYTIGSDTITAGADGTLPIKKEWFGITLSITRNGNDKDKLDSDPQSLPIPARPAKPTPTGVDVSTAGGTGKLTGLTAGTAYEVSTDGGKTWASHTADGSGQITGLLPGTYVVRVKAGADNFVSEPSDSVKIGAYQIKVTFMVDGAKYREVSVDYGAALTDIPPVPAKDNAIGAWCMDEQGTTPAVFTNITADMTVYAVYTTAYTVTLQTGTGYTLSAQGDSESPVKEGGSFTFRFALADGYQRNADFAVKVNGVKVELTAQEPYTYTITDIRENKTVTVEGVGKKPGGKPSNLGGGDKGDEPEPTPPPSEPSDDTPSTPPVKPPAKVTPPAPAPGETPPAEKQPEGRPGTTPKQEESGEQEPESTGTKKQEKDSADAGQTEKEPQAEKKEIKIGNGTVIVTVVCEEEKCTATVADTEKVVKAVLTPDQQELVNGGETIEIRIDVTDISEKVPAQDKEVIESGIWAYREEVPGLVLGMYVDISMFIKIGAGDWNAITETDEPIEVVVNIPEKLLSDNREFYIIRAHNGEYTFMNDLDDAQDTITVSTDLFSSYAIAYVEMEGAGADSGAKCGLCHICPTFLGICYFIWLAIIIALVLVIYLIIRRKRKEEENEEQ